MMFQRTAIIYGEPLCRKLERGCVAICGAGAVGSFAAEALCRLGVGEFHIFDFDVFEQSNKNRQLCALDSTIGKSKAQVQCDRILDINPLARAAAHDVFIDETSLGQIFDAKPDVIVDAIDSIHSKVLLACAAIECGVPIVSSMGAARKKNPLEVKTADIFKTYACPLAARIRKALRQNGIKKGYKCVFSSEIVEEQTHLSGQGGALHGDGADLRSMQVPLGGGHFGRKDEACDNCDIAPESAFSVRRGRGGDLGLSARKTKIIGSSIIVTGVFGLNLANLALEEFSNKK